MIDAGATGIVCRETYPAHPSTTAPARGGEAVARMTSLRPEAGDIAVYPGDQGGPCAAPGRSSTPPILPLLRRDIADLTAAINPPTRPCYGVPHSLCFAIEIVERIKLVGDRLSTPRAMSGEQQVGGNPAVR